MKSREDSEQVQKRGLKRLIHPKFLNGKPHVFFKLSGLKPAKIKAFRIRTKISEAERFCRASALQLEVIYGGGSKQQQLAGLRKLPSVLVATPGRLLEFLEDPA